MPSSINHTFQDGVRLELNGFEGIATHPTLGRMELRNEMTNLIHAAEDFANGYWYDPGQEWPRPYWRVLARAMRDHMRARLRDVRLNLASDTSEDVQLELTRRLHLQPQILDALIGSVFPRVRAAIAAKRTFVLSEVQLERLRNDSDPIVVRALQNREPITGSC